MLCDIVGPRYSPMAHKHVALVHKKSYYNTQISDVLLEVHKTSVTEGVKPSTAGGKPTYE